jgi:carboxymethylenebutenolidase
MNADDHANAPGIVLAGVPPSALERVHERYAAHGFRVAVVAVDGAAGVEEGLAAVRAAVAGLRGGTQARVAVAGYGTAGRFAYLAATRLDIDAAVAFSAAGIAAHLDEAGNLRVPLSCHFGDDDAAVGPGEVRLIKGALEGFATVDVYRYAGASGGFALPGDPGYDAVAAEAAERRAFAMLEALR